MINQRLLRLGKIEKKYDKKTKILKTKETGNILTITFKDKKLSSNVSIYDKMGVIKLYTGCSTIV